MDNACAGKDEYVLTTEVMLNQNFRRSLPSYEDKATIKNCKMIPRGDKVLAACCPGVSFATLYHPTAIGLKLVVPVLFALVFT